MSESSCKFDDTASLAISSTYGGVSIIVLICVCISSFREQRSSNIDFRIAVSSADEQIIRQMQKNTQGTENK